MKGIPDFEIRSGGYLATSSLATSFTSSLASVLASVTLLKKEIRKYESSKIIFFRFFLFIFLFIPSIREGPPETEYPILSYPYPIPILSYSILS